MRRLNMQPPLCKKTQFLLQGEGMRNLVIDENLPRSIGAIFAQHGFEVYDVRDHGLRGFDDSAVFNFATVKNAIVATSDIVFANSVHHSREDHYGFFLIRLSSSLSLKTREQEIDRALIQIGDQDIKNKLVVVSPGSIRLHQKHELL